MTRRTLIGSGVVPFSATEGLDRPAQPFVQPDLGPVAEDAFGLAQIGPRVADIAGSRRQVLLVDGLPEDGGDRVRELVHAGRRAGGDVEYLAARALLLTGLDRRVDDV